MFVKISDNRIVNTEHLTAIERHKEVSKLMFMGDQLEMTIPNEDVALIVDAIGQQKIA